MKKVFIQLFITLIFLTDCIAQTVTFQKVYGREGLEEDGLSIVQTIDDGYMVLSRGFTCMRTDRFGDSLWTGRIQTPGLCIQNTSDHNFIITSFQYSLMKFDINGNTLWTKNFFQTTAGNYVAQTSDNGFVLSGTIFGPERPYLVKTDSAGTLQ